MNARYTITIGFVLTLILGCKQNTTKQSVKENDTTRILTLLFDTAIVRKGIPDAKYLIGDSIFRDSIIFKSNYLLNDYIPKSVNYKLKIMTENELCDLAILYDHKFDKFISPYLELTRFEKKDSSYQVSLVNNSMHSTRDKDGKYHQTPMGFPYDSSDCAFNLRRGSIHMSFIKLHDSIIAKVDGILWDY